MLRVKLSVFFILFAFIAVGQRLEFGLALGLSNYQGDITPNITLKEWNSCSGLFFKVNPDQYFSFTTSIVQSRITASDQNFEFLKQRNLSFETSLMEFSERMELNFFPFSVRLNPKKMTPFILTGFTMYRSDPKTSYNGSIVKLAPLDTEGKKLTSGNRHSYLVYQLAIPIGGGLKFQVGRKLIFSYQLTYTYSFSDYLDDVSTTYYDVDILENTYGQLSANLCDRSTTSFGFNGKQRGRSDQNDWFIFNGFTFSYRIPNPDCFKF